MIRKNGLSNGREGKTVWPKAKAWAEPGMHVEEQRWTTKHFIRMWDLYHGKVIQALAIASEIVDPFVYLFILICFLHNLRSDKIWFTSRMSYLLLSVSWLRKAREKHPKEKMMSSKSCFCWVTPHYMLHKRGVPVCFCSPTEFPGSDYARSGGHALDKYSLLLNGSSVLWLILSLSQRRKWLGETCWDGVCRGLVLF